MNWTILSSGALANMRYYSKLVRMILFTKIGWNCKCLVISFFLFFIN